MALRAGRPRKRGWQQSIWNQWIDRISAEPSQLDGFGDQHVDLRGTPLPPRTWFLMFQSTTAQDANVMWMYPRIIEYRENSRGHRRYARQM